jgi:hypothetical protein
MTELRIAPMSTVLYSLASSAASGFAGLRVCGFAGLRVCGFAGLRVCGFAGLRVCGFAGYTISLQESRRFAAKTCFSKYGLRATIKTEPFFQNRISVGCVRLGTQNFKNSRRGRRVEPTPVGVAKQGFLTTVTFDHGFFHQKSAYFFFRIEVRFATNRQKI